MPDNRKMKTDPTIAYQYHPNGYQKCELCAMFQPNAGCTAVHGFIAKDGWCQIWRTKNTARTIEA